MSIGIDIQVNSRQVRDAKQQIDMLNRSLNDTDALGDLNIGENGLPQASQRIREMAEQVRRLQTLSRQGTSKGGILDPRQFQEAAALMRSINASTQEYARNITAVRNEMQQLSRAQADMRRNGQAGTEEFRSNRERIRQLQDERRVLEENERHYRRYGAQGSTAANDISGMNQQQGQGMNLKKALGWTLAAAGGFSILGFLSQSRAKYQQSVGQAAELHARGIQGADGGVGMGYGPLEYQGLLGNLSQSTGVSGDAAQRKAYATALFARSQGVDLNQAAELHTQTYKATGNNNLSNNMMIGLTATGIERSKMPELLQQIAKNTQVMSAAQGGAGLSQDMMLMSAYAAVQAMKQGDKEGAVFAKSGEFANFMTNGMQDAGTPAGNLMLFQALGGFDGKFDYAKIHQMDKVKSEGFWNHIDVFDKLMERAPKLRGKKGTEEYKQSVDERSGWWATHFKGTMAMSPKARELMAESRNPGGILEGYSGNKEDMLKRLNTLIAAGGDKGERAKELKAEIEKNPEVSKLSLEALREKEQIETGKKIHEMLGNIEKGMLETFGKVMDGDFKGAIKALNDAIGPAGIALGTAGGLMHVAGLSLNTAGVGLNLAATRLGAAPMLAGAGAAPLVAGTAAALGVTDAIVAAKTGKSVTNSVARQVGLVKSKEDIENGTDSRSNLNPLKWIGKPFDMAFEGAAQLTNATDDMSAYRKKTPMPYDPSFKGLAERTAARMGMQSPQTPMPYDPSFKGLKDRFFGRFGLKTQGKKLISDNGDGTSDVRHGNRNWRNNNPGNIEYGDFAKRNGAIGSDGRFAIFPDYSTGRKAKENLLFGENSKYKNLSISAAVERWAPKSENPNNANYKAAAIRAAGGKDVKLSALTQEQREKMMDEMERQEGYKQGSIYTVSNKDMKAHGKESQAQAATPAPVPTVSREALMQNSPTDEAVRLLGIIASNTMRTTTATAAAPNK